MPTDDSPLQAAADTASDVVEQATDAVDRAIAAASAFADLTEETVRG